MHCCVLFASPRGKNSNTLALLTPFLEEWHRLGHTHEVFSLYDMNLSGCRACRGCQSDWTQPACVIQDDMQPVFEAVSRADLVLLAAPVYSWFCPAPMKAALDRLVYAFDKFYGEQGKGPALMAGKSFAALMTAGYRPEKATDLFDEAMKRWCKHSGTRWHGIAAERHLGYHTQFMDEDKAAHAVEFARRLAQEVAQ